MIDDNDVQAALGQFRRWVEVLRPYWARTKNMYTDRSFQPTISGLEQEWKKTAQAISSITLSGGESPFGDGSNPLGSSRAWIQVNEVKPWVASMMASLFYRGAQVALRPDPSTEEEALDQDKVDGVQTWTNGFFRRQDIEAAGENAFQTSLMYDGGGAFKIGWDPDAEELGELCWLEHLLPWEFLADRKALPGRERYFGHLYWLTAEEYKEKFKGELPEGDLATPPNVVDDGQSPVIPIAGRQVKPGHVQVLEFYDLTARVKVGDKVEKGEVRFYRILNPVSQLPGTALTSEPQLARIQLQGRCPMLEWGHGSTRPVVNIVPVVVDNVPDQPLFNVAPVNGVVELNGELNLLVSAIATGFRRDCQRVGIYDEDVFKNDMVTAYKSGEDMVMVPMKPTADGGLADPEKVVAFLTQQPMSPTVLQYRRELETALKAAQMTASFTRGTQGQYVSATEATLLNAYTETTIGRIRKRMNDALGRVVKVFLRFTQEALSERKGKGAKIKVVLPDKTAVTLDQDVFDRGWIVELEEGSATPIAQQTKKTEFLQILPVLEKAYEMASSPEAPASLRAANQRLVELIVRMWDLPQSLDWSTLAVDADEEPAQTAPVEQPPAQPAGPQPVAPGQGTPPALQAILSAHQ